MRPSGLGAQKGQVVAISALASRIGYAGDDQITVEPVRDTLRTAPPQRRRAGDPNRLAYRTAMLEAGSHAASRRGTVCTQDTGSASAR